MTTVTGDALAVNAVTVYYGPVLALDNVTVSLPPGRICGLVGMNGSGKSTLLKSIMGLLRPASGTVRIHGKTPLAARKAGIVGYMPQSEAIDWDFPLSVRDVVLTGRYGHMGPYRRASRADHHAVDEALARVNLDAHHDRHIGQLSGGQRKRTFLARCLAQNPAVLLLDEPFAGVDKPSEAMISDVLHSLVAGGTTIMVSTHDLHALPSLVDEAILLMRTVLLHDHPDVVLQPHNLARAFGVSTGELNTYADTHTPS